MSSHTGLKMIFFDKNDVIFIKFSTITLIKLLKFAKNYVKFDENHVKFDENYVKLNKNDIIFIENDHFKSRF